MNIVEIFGKNVKRYRIAHQLSQEQLAEKCGLHRTYVSSIERCQRNVSLQNVQKIADAIGVNVYQLLIEEEIHDNP